MKKTKSTIGKKIYLCDLKREDDALKREAASAIKRVLAGGWYILGPELEGFEKEFASYCGSSYAIGVASGTDALKLSLESLSIGPGDEVITAVNTAIPTAMAISAAGATPIFADVGQDTFNIDPAKIEKAITKKTRAIIPVHLYGNFCAIDDILKVSRKHGLFVIEDACQAHGASYNGRRSGTFGKLGAFSFYPTKNLGCYGDGGMIITDDKKLASGLRLLRNYGHSNRYICETDGINSRLDEMQAAVLRVKLKYLDRFNERRKKLAQLYKKYLEAIPEVNIPNDKEDSSHIFHLYVIKCADRDGLRRYLSDNNIESQIHYPVPLHMQRPFKKSVNNKQSFPIAEDLSQKILSLPMFPMLSEYEIKRICGYVKKFYKR